MQNAESPDCSQPATAWPRPATGIDYNRRQWSWKKHCCARWGKRFTVFG
jgi:hypothetical protein